MVHLLPLLGGSVIVISTLIVFRTLGVTGKSMHVMSFKTQKCNKAKRESRDNLNKLSTVYS